MRTRFEVRGFFLMEVMILVIVFVSFSIVIAGWYSNFSLKKMDIIKRGRAIFIASDILESIRMYRKVPNNFNEPPGYKVSAILNEDMDLKNFAEVAVFVEFSERLAPVCLSTGILLEQEELKDRQILQEIAES